ncbi:MAG: zf-HC2 domain-containing protein [Burkholderiales bacterium]|nr:zf-HC2 domain-containing protein [Burkholderiales bacterium]
MSGQILRLEPDPHVAVQRLLPWYLTGRLETAEHDIVETHLAQCPECRAELETERQWQLLHPGHGAQGDVEEGWARMRARLSGELPVTAPAPLLETMPLAVPRRRGWLPPAWRTPARVAARAWATPALLSVALLAAIGLTLRPVAPAAQYVALSAPAEAGATAVVRFKPEATEAQIRHSLKDSGARLVDGPTVSDAYVVRLPREHYAAALDKLRQEPGVALVEALESASP